MNDAQISLRINENVRICKLYDGTEYVLVYTKTERIPMFLKKRLLDILREIKEKRATKEQLVEKYGEEVNAEIEMLYKYSIICSESECENDICLEGDYSKWIALLDAKSYEKRSPVLAKIELTYACNYKCKFCYIEGVSQKILSLEKIKRMLDKLKKAGIIDLFLTGGEPFVHPNMLEIIDYAYKLGFDIIIQTNASFLDEEMVAKLKKYKRISYGISFHSANEEIFDEFTQVKGAYKKTVDAIERLHNNGMKFFLKYTVTTENEVNMKKDIEYLESTGYEYMVTLQLLPSIDDSCDNSKFGATVENMDWLYKNNYITHKPSNCSAFRTKMWIAPNGDVYPCEMVRKKMGNLVEQPFEEIWFGEKADEVLCSEIYTEPEQCKKCTKKEYCNKCLAYNNFQKWSTKMEFFCTRAGIVKKTLESKDEK